ncbi:MAG: hypothetical protein ABIH50_02245 [bacterium]
MKKILSGLLLLALLVPLSGTSMAAKKKVYKGPKPVFPKAGAKVNTIKKVMKSQPEVKPAANKMSFLVEGGFGGGGALVQLGLEKPIAKGMNYGAGIGFGLGNGYNVVVLEPAKLSFGSNNLFYGVGLTYAMYSAVVDLSIIKPSSKSLFGIGFFIGKDFGPVQGTLGLDSALGLKATASYYF